jgi:hypothetical protein
MRSAMMRQTLLTPGAQAGRRRRREAPRCEGRLDRRWGPAPTGRRRRHVRRQHGTAGTDRGDADVETARSAASRRAFGDAAMGARPPRWLRRRLPALDVGEDVGLLDRAAGRLDLREVDAVLLGELPGQGRGLDRRARRATRAR